MQKLELQKAKIEHLPQIEAIIREAYVPILKVLSRPPGALNDTDKKIKESFSNHELFIITLSDRIIGTVSLKEQDEETCKMYHFSIAPPYQRQGYGKWVVQEVSRVLKRRNSKIKAIKLEIYEKTPHLKTFYEKQGYIQTGEKTVLGEKIFILSGHIHGQEIEKVNSRI
ncbi:MAG: GNAT family N-acetyltransferase [Candidatus Heimdallarchaeota archaeon]